MNFIKQYKKRFNVLSEYIENEPNKDLNICIVIPCFNEPDLITSLKSLSENTNFNSEVEVIVVVNSSEKSDKKILEQNKKTIADFEKFILEQKSKIKFYLIHKPNLTHKFAGVGLARKIGMDEAAIRFAKISKPNGIIVNFDADTTCEQNYIQAIENQFIIFPKTNACSIRYEHPIEGSEYDDKIYHAIILYELYLHYYIQALRLAKFPYAYHTIGSAFAVRADVYTKQGGMNTRKAGEDFYFLHKIIPLGNFCEIKNTCIYPSPRPSNRVPFGTGKAVNEIIEENDTEYLTYNLDSFLSLKNFFKDTETLYQNNKFEKNKIDKILYDFLLKNNFEKALKEINKNSSNLHTFKKRFYDWFNAFRVLKFMNFSHENYYKKISILTESKKLLNRIKPETKTDELSAKQILEIYRKL